MEPQIRLYPIPEGATIRCRTVWGYNAAGKPVRCPHRPFVLVGQERKVALCRTCFDAIKDDGKKWTD